MIHAIAALLVLAADAPPSDYVAEVKWLNSQTPYSTVLRRHGDFYREDFQEVAGVRKAYRNTRNYHRFSATYRDGRLVGMTAGDIDEPNDPPPELRKLTGRKGEALGEVCDIWRYEKPMDGYVFFQSGCVTADGVEMWQEAGSSRNGVDSKISPRT